MQYPHMETSLSLKGTFDNAEQARLALDTNLSRLTREGYVICDSVYRERNGKHFVLIVAESRKK